MPETDPCTAAWTTLSLAASVNAKKRTAAVGVVGDDQRRCSQERRCCARNSAARVGELRHPTSGGGLAATKNDGFVSRLSNAPRNSALSWALLPRKYAHPQDWKTDEQPTCWQVRTRLTPSDVATIVLPNARFRPGGALTRMASFELGGQSRGASSDSMTALRQCDDRSSRLNFTASRATRLVAKRQRQALLQWAYDSRKI